MLLLIRDKPLHDLNPQDVIVNFVEAWARKDYAQPMIPLS